jgi:hypothetical protein
MGKFNDGDVYVSIVESCAFFTRGKKYVVVAAEDSGVNLTDDEGDNHFIDSSMLESDFIKVITSPLNICSGMTYEEAQKLEPGDKVKVLFSTKGMSYCPYSGTKVAPWCDKDDKHIGSVLTFDRLWDGDACFPGVEFKESGADVLPWFCLQLVEKANKPKEMTIEQIQEKLGHKVKVVEG